MANPLQPPGPYDDFNFSFDPALHNLFPPSLPSSADLFSPSETTDLFGFLDNLNWDLEAEVQNVVKSPEAIPPHYAEQQQQPQHSPSAAPINSPPSHPHPHSHIPTPSMQTIQESPVNTPQSQGPSPSEMTEASPTPPPSHTILNTTPSMAAQARPKVLLTTPQKRLNHIMSEQKRRNAIRDGYVQLTTLLAPAGAPPGTGMPTRGRPKGSSSRNNGRNDGKAGGVAFKGKSGILFRAVEYVKWLEEGRDALLAEVMKLEAAAGIHRS